MFDQKKIRKERKSSGKMSGLKNKTSAETKSTRTIGDDILIDPNLDKFKGKEYQPAKYKELENCAFTFSSPCDSSSLK